MSYQVHRFEVSDQGKLIPVAIHVVTDGDETNYIVSAEAHENFEIYAQPDGSWKAEAGAAINESLLELILQSYTSSNS